MQLFFTTDNAGSCLNILGTIYKCSSTEKFESIQDLSNEGYYERLKEGDNFINAEVLSNDLQYKPYDKYFDTNAFNSNNFRNKDEILSSSFKSADSNYLKNDEFKRNVRNINLHDTNCRMTNLYDSIPKNSEEINLESLYRRKKSIEKDEEKDDVVNDMNNSDNHATNINHKESYDKSAEKDNTISEQYEIKTKLPYNIEKQNVSGNRADKKDGADVEPEYFENEVSNEGNFKRKYSSHGQEQKILNDKGNSGKRVTSSLLQYNFRIEEPKDLNKIEDADNSSGKNESDVSKKKPDDKLKKFENKDLIIIQPVQEGEIRNDAISNFASKENLRINGVKHNIYGVGDVHHVIKNSDKNFPKKDILFQSNGPENHNKQFSELSPHHTHEFETFKNWKENGLDNKPHEVDARSGILKSGNNYFYHLDNSKPESQRNLPGGSLDNNKKIYSTNQEDAEHNHQSIINQMKHTNFANSNEHYKDDKDQCLKKQTHLSWSNEHENRPSQTSFKSLSHFGYNDELYPQINKKFTEESDNFQNTNKSFRSGEESDYGNMCLLKQKLDPIIDENDKNDLASSLLYPVVNPLVNFPQDYVNLTNDCSSDSPIVHYSNENQDIYQGLNVYSNSQYTYEKNFPHADGFDNEKYSEFDPFFNISEFDVLKLHRSKRKDSDGYNILDPKERQTDDLKKRSILQKQRVALGPFHKNDFSDENSDYAEEIANFSNGNVKSVDTIYDYDFSENDENTRENNFDDINGGGQRNIISKEISKQISEPVYEIEKNNQNSKTQKHKNTKKKNNKSNILFDNSNGVLNDDNRIVAFNVKKYKNKIKKVEQTPEESNHDLSVTTATPGLRSPASKNLSESRMTNLVNHLSYKSVEKQCHPPAGPPKFRWCSETSNPVKDQEYEDALKGKVALRIVEVILAKVQKSSKMTTDFGFCKNQKRPTALDDENECIAQNSLLKSEDLKDIMSSLDKMSYKGCNQLPPKLREFLEWLVKVKRVRSIHSQNMKSEKHSHSNCSLGESAFLFHRYNTHPSTSYQEPEVRKKGFNPSVPYETVVDYDYDNLSNRKVSLNNRKILNPDSLMSSENTAEDYNSLLEKEPISDVIPDENLFKIENSLVSEQTGPLLMEKQRRQAKENEMNFIDHIINSDDDNRNNDFLKNPNDADTMSNNFIVEEKGEKQFQYNPKNNIDSLRDLTKYDPEVDEPHGKNVKIEKDNVPKLHKKFNNRKLISNEVNSFENNFKHLKGMQNKIKDRKVKLQELFGEKFENLNFDLDQNEQNKLRSSFDKCVEGSDDVQKIKRETNNGNEKQMGFYTPVVIHVSDEYEM